MSLRPDKIDIDNDKFKYYDKVNDGCVWLLARHANDLDNPEGTLNIVVTAKTFHHLITQVQKVTGTN